MRIFLSYARVDKSSIEKFLDMLDIHDVWYDHRLYAGQDWWTEILRRLHWCEAFIYLLSPDSVQSYYCMEEFKRAQEYNKYIIPVVINDLKDISLPEEIKRLHWIDVTKGFDIEATKRLLHAVYMAEKNQREKQEVNLETQTIPSFPIPATDDEYSPPLSDMAPSILIADAAEAMDQDNYDKALFILMQVKEKGYESKYVDIDELIQEARTGLDEVIRKRENEEEYNTIAVLVNAVRTRPFGLKALERWLEAHPNPDDDPLNLRRYITVQTGTATEVSEAQTVVISPSSGNGHRNGKTALRTDSDGYASTVKLPLFEMLDIPAGEVQIPTPEGDEQVIQVPRFSMSKYPITNQQFEVFLERGYKNERWWRFSEHATNWHRANPDPRAPRFEGDERPRETVSWFEAVAFCHWLSGLIGMRVSLPTLVQWRRAAIGDNRHVFAYGSEFDPKLCNTRESRIRVTTPVTKYPGGASPFGVMDMAGNVWEWLLDANPDDTESMDISIKAPRALVGGSYVTSKMHTRVDSHFYLDPEYYYGTIGFRVVGV